MSEKIPKTDVIYKKIIDSLISEMKDEFVNEGSNEDVLKELKTVSLDIFDNLIIIQIWENKMIEAGIFNPNKVNNYIHHLYLNLFIF